MAFIFPNKDAEAYLAEVRVQADKLGLREKLEAKLTWLDDYANHPGKREHRCVLYKDFAPLSFGFHIETKQDDGTWKYWFNGGMIFHGQHDRGGDGGAPSFAVNLVAVDDDWSIHT